MWTTRNGGYSYSIRKTYKDKATGEYKEAKQFFPEELEVLRRLIDEALTWKDGANATTQFIDNLVSGIVIPDGKGGQADIDDDIPF